MKQIILIFSLLIIINKNTFAQCDGRYQSEIFTNTNKVTVNYSDVYLDTYHEMDIYTPVGDSETNRPVIIFIHGGSYIGGSKSEIDCIDFCEAFAKKGYVTASVNYRLATDPISFVLSQEEQYLTVLKSVADVKAAIRYFRKDFSNGNNYNIDPNTIFVGGSSAGAVTAIHLGYIDLVTDLPTTSSPNGTSVQDLVNNMGGLDGDAGNNGFSSDVSGVISFAGGINNPSWIDTQDEPLISVQGTSDQTISFNCAPGLGYPTVLDLCGSNEMHNQANNVNILNDLLVFQGADHDWFQSGNNDPRFIQAIDFTTSFLYPLLPCNQSTNITDVNKIENNMLEIIDINGRRVSKMQPNNAYIHIYESGKAKKRIIIKE